MAHLGGAACRQAASSANAQRHGLTGAIQTDAVLSWYRVILEDATAVPDPFEQDSYLRAAADLARAEAQLQRVRKAEEGLLGSKPQYAESREAYDDPRNMILGTLLDEALFGKRLTVAREGRFLREPFRRPAEIEDLYDLLEKHANDSTVRMGWDKKGFTLLRRTDRAIGRHFQKRLMDHEKQGRTLARYRATAEARRTKALRRWTEEIAKRSQFEGGTSAVANGQS